MIVAKFNFLGGTKRARFAVPEWKIENMKRNVYRYAFALVGALVLLYACQTHFFRHNYKETNKLLHETGNLKEKPFLKAHMHNGDVFIFRNTWQVDSLENTVIGWGEHYDFNRTQLRKGSLEVAVDSVAIFETNLKLKNTQAGNITAVTVLMAANLALTAYCAANPKACFGSCPTFYVNEGDNFHYADAEGFSNAIAPSLEYGDVDALNAHQAPKGNFSLTLKNEALETHCLNKVELWAYPIQEGERVYQTRKNKFFLCESEYEPISAIGPEGDIASLLAKADRKERFSLSDKQNLSSKEEIILEFKDVPRSKDLGLLVHFRQTLMTTYFIYSAMGYMGDEVGDVFARLEREKTAKSKLDKGLKSVLGELEIHVWNEKDQSWELQGAFYETGPIAINRQLLALQNKTHNGQLKVKLLINKGLWRIDYVGLTQILKPVEPKAYLPCEVLSNETPQKRAYDALHDSGQYFTTFPGERYTLNFELPNSKLHYEMFLNAQGYYLEWMREDWIKDKDLFKLWQMFERPATYLKDEASAYKEYEKTMEQQFWSSKIETPNVFDYEL